MAATAMTSQPTTAPVEFEDIQGIVRFAYKHHTEASFLLLRVKDAVAAREWLAAAPVTSAVVLNPVPSTALQIALTAEGLTALGVASDIVGGFSPEFLSGMTGNANRARRLGDVGSNDPSTWQWGVGHRVPHAVVLLYALPGRLAGWQSAVEQQLAAGFERIACLPTADMHGVEPFGFVDGISQPEIDWARTRAAKDEQRLEYSNVTCLGEMLLGYPNEYGLYTDRPLVDPPLDPGGLLPRAEDCPDRADVGRNGSYLVMRQLQQDVRGFWHYLDRQTGNDPARRAALGAAMVGRTLQGKPLERESHAATPGSAASAADDLNAFTYRDDPAGTRCPVGAHIRRSNPRNADLPRGGSGLVSRLIRTLGLNSTALHEDLVASTRFHRLLRRGREYGTAIPPAEAVTGPATSTDSGLQFLCLGANIGRQFEFVQSAWLAGGKFNGLANERDPLLGNRLPDPAGTPTDVYSIPAANGPSERLTGVPPFIRVLGGAYCFLPGIRALRYLATTRTPP